MQVEAIVPAFNEGTTIAGVVSSLVASSRVSKVIVVDDGSSDATASIAESAGAEVIRISPNGGKGKAMLRALKETTSEYVGFFDADLKRFLPSHVDRMVDTAALGFDMVCGLRDFGPVHNAIQIACPIITGERICRRTMLDQIPISCWSGYAIETAMNDVIKRKGYRAAAIILDDVSIRHKTDKGGFLKGLGGYLTMFAEILETQANLGKSCGTACSAK